MPSRRRILVAVLVVLLCAKYLWSLTVSPVPFGYDAGMYRFLLLRHAEGWPPLFTAALPPWSSAHPLGLFAFTTPLIKLGVPVDALLGWMWNLFVVVLACVLAWVVSRERGARVGVAVLAVFFVSVAQHEGFLAMYAKVMVALLWCALALHFAERRQRRWILFGMLAIATHLQVGLVLGLAVASSFAFRLLSGDKNGSKFLLWTGAVTAVLGGLWYLPNYAQAIVPVAAKVWDSVNPVSLLIAGILIVAMAVASVAIARVRKQLLSEQTSFVTLLVVIAVAVLGGSVALSGVVHGEVAGSFLSLPRYIQLSMPLLVLGVIGFVLSVRSGERGSAWQWALVWCAVLVCSRFFFYQRFLLLVDFFLLPFAALALERLWFNRDHAVRWFAAAVIAVQCFFALQHLSETLPQLSPVHLSAIQAAAAQVPDGAHVLVLENLTAPWVLGYMPHAQIVAPGVFVSPDYDAWEGLMYGTPEQRRAFFLNFPAPVFVYASDAFTSYYPPETVTGVLTHPCLKPTAAPGLFAVACP